MSSIKAFAFSIYSSTCERMVCKPLSMIAWASCCNARPRAISCSASFASIAMSSSFSTSITPLMLPASNISMARRFRSLIGLPLLIILLTSDAMSSICASSFWISSWHFTRSITLFRKKTWLSSMPKARSWAMSLSRLAYFSFNALYSVLAEAKEMFSKSAIFLPSNVTMPFSTLSRLSRSPPVLSGDTKRSNCMMKCNFMVSSVA